MKTIKIENIGGIDIIWQLCLNPQCIIITELCLPLLFCNKNFMYQVEKKAENKIDSNIIRKMNFENQRMPLLVAASSMILSP